MKYLYLRDINRSTFFAANTLYGIYFFFSCSLFVNVSSLLMCCHRMKDLIDQSSESKYHKFVPRWAHKINVCSCDDGINAFMLTQAVNRTIFFLYYVMIRTLNYEWTWGTMATSSWQSIHKRKEKKRNESKRLLF